MTRRILILGAGFGGLELASRLSEEAADQVDVTLIDQSDAFVFGYSKLDVMFGRSTPESVRLPYAAIAKPGVSFRRETVRSIDPAARSVVTDRSTYSADVLVVALGADLDPAATPGLVEEGTEYYSMEGAERVARMLPSFEGGDVVIAVLGPFFKCPAAPFETALMLDDYLSRRDRRERSTIKVVSPMPAPIPVSKEASDGILAALADRDIDWWPQSLVTSLDRATTTALLADGRSTRYDLFLGVPVHRAPQVVLDAGMTTDGWIAVDPRTFATSYPGVYAVGDVTSAPVPRVGVIAEGEARTVAQVLLHQILGGSEPAAYGGIATCYIEFGGDEVAKFDADFLGGPQPFGTFSPPTAELAESKRLFGATRRSRWFGLGTEPARPPHAP
jgi:sulfide:quinone oxidoreductase